MSDSQSHSKSDKQVEAGTCCGCSKEIPVSDGTLVPAVRHLETLLKRPVEVADIVHYLLCGLCVPVLSAAGVDLHPLAAQLKLVTRLEEDRRLAALRQERMATLVPKLLGRNGSAEFTTRVADSKNPYQPQTPRGEAREPKAK